MKQSWKAWRLPERSSLNFLIHGSRWFMGFSGGTSGKEPACRCGKQEMPVWSLGLEDPLKQGMATHFSILAWRMPRTEESGGLQSTGSARVGHDWRDLARTHACVLNKLSTLKAFYLKKKGFITKRETFRSPHQKNTAIPASTGRIR